MGNVIFTNGCFDVLHPMHFNLLSYCRKLAGFEGIVYVGMDSDEKVEKDKGPSRPIFTLGERKRNILSLNDYSTGLPLVDDVISFSTNQELYDLIKSLEPNIIVKGSDWQGNVVGSDLCEVRIFKYEPHISSTSIIHRVLVKNFIPVERSSSSEFKVDPFERG